MIYISKVITFSRQQTAMTHMLISNFAVPGLCYQLYRLHLCRLICSSPLLMEYNLIRPDFIKKKKSKKNNLMLNSTEHEIYHARKLLNANKCWHFNIY